MTKTAQEWREIAVAAHAGGNHAAAVEAFKNALSLVGDDAVLFFEASIPHLLKNELPEALNYLEACIRLDATHVNAHLNAGLVLRNLGERDRAYGHFERVLALDPGNAQAANNMAVHYVRQGDRQKAIALLTGTVTANPDHLQARQNLAGLLHQSGLYEDAAEHYGYLIARSPDDETARFLLDAASQSSIDHQKVSAAPQDYVRGLFDNYAETFETDLAERLGYDAPRQLWDMIAQHRSTFGLAVDIGCGTGIAAPFLRPVSETLVGIDLSGEMLRKASERKMYDTLHQVDAVSFLTQCRDADLIIAADVLIYIGDPSAFLAAASKALMEDGLLALTTESTGEGEADLVLRVSGRFAHARSGLVEALGALSLDLIGGQEVNIRKGENGNPVRGDLLLFRKHVLPGNSIGN